MEKPLNENEFSELILSVGTGRSKRHLQPIQVAEYIKRAISAGALYGANTFPYTQKSLAEKLGLRGTSMVNRFLSLLEIPEEFQAIVSWGAGKGGLSHLTFSIAAAVAGVTKEQQKQLLQEVLKYKLTKDETVAAVQTLKRNPGMTVQKATETIIATRPEIIRQEIIVGEFSKDSAMLGPNLTPELKDTALRRAIRSIVGQEQMAARTSGRKFIIATSPRGKTLLEEHWAKQDKQPGEFISGLCTEMLANQ